MLTVIIISHPFALLEIDVSGMFAAAEVMFCHVLLHFLSLFQVFSTSGAMKWAFVVFSHEVEYGFVRLSQA